KYKRQKKNKEKKKTDKEETKINGAGDEITEAEQTTLLEKLKQLEQGDYIIISGSRPNTIPFEFYERIATVVRKKHAYLILDIPEQQVEKLICYQPLLMKPNNDELAAITGKQIDTKQDAIEGAKDLVNKGAQNVIVSL